MKTIYDLRAAGDDIRLRADFIAAALRELEASPRYRDAQIAERYYARHNVTIERWQRMLYTVRGRQIADPFGAQYKLKTLFFRRFVIGQTQYVLSNGVSFDDPATAALLGGDFSARLQQLAKRALVDGTAFGFWNWDHLEVFGLAETPVSPGFCPIRDPETGALAAGIRFWHRRDGERRILRAALYEPEGITDYIGTDGALEPMGPRRPYASLACPGGLSVPLKPPGTLPILPLYANDLHTGELQGIRESIDAYDFIKSGLANDIDDTAGFYWILQNTGGMDDLDLARFVERLKTVKAAVVDGDSGVTAEAHTLEVPTAAREAMLALLEKDLYRDFGLVNPADLTAGTRTATEIRLAYQGQDDKCADFEYCLIEFITALLSRLGVRDTPHFRWNRVANQSEETAMVLSAAQYLDRATVLHHLPWLTDDECERLLSGGAEDRQICLNRV